VGGPDDRAEQPCDHRPHRKVLHGCPAISRGNPCTSKTPSSPWPTA
jgi:hypothetical protein